MCYNTSKYSTLESSVTWWKMMMKVVCAFLTIRFAFISVDGNQRGRKLSSHPPLLNGESFHSILF